VANSFACLNCGGNPVRFVADEMEHDRRLAIEAGEKFTLLAKHMRASKDRVFARKMPDEFYKIRECASHNQLISGTRIRRGVSSRMRR
jgi:hypothetical protein